MGRPSISVVIPTRGRPQAISRCLAALGRTALSAAEIEMIVVGDGMDVSPPPPVAGESIPVVWLRQPHRGPAAARNAGAAAASAPVLAFTDDDCAPTPDWVEQILTRSSTEPNAVIGGRVRNALSENPWSEASHLVLDVFIDLCNARDNGPGFVPRATLHCAARCSRRSAASTSASRPRLARTGSFAGAPMPPVIRSSWPRTPSSSTGTSWLPRPA